VIIIITGRKYLAYISQEFLSNTLQMFIDEVMDLVELTRLKHAMVGLAGATGLSAEQQKRLTIAVELVASPSIIFMDEPTTGLDARAAAIVMRTVRKTVDTGRTVVCTIHQPNIEIFESFDEVRVSVTLNRYYISKNSCSKTR
jgi:ABC-type multidrug transport system ATPase subunit